jgi:alpha-galactosidase/6-phospho-beta-glucosidase family protein
VIGLVMAALPQAPVPERSTLNSEPGSPTTEHRTPITDHRSPNTDHRTPTPNIHPVPQGLFPVNLVFVGGGSYRIVPILREALGSGDFLHGSQFRLVDCASERAEAVGRLLQRVPEWAPAGCTVTWGSDLDRALDGADVLYVTMAMHASPSYELSSAASVRRGFISSDQISATGAFLALHGAPVILDFARRMERLCPQALLLVFANPVAVYSGLVNNHTRIRALGICGGFTNHRWDLSRLMGRDGYCDEFDVDVAGVNHLSYILKGSFRGEDLYRVLGRHLTPDWRPPRLKVASPVAAGHIRFALRKLAWMYHHFGTIIYSTELDGMAHLFYEDTFPRISAGPRHLTRTQAQAAALAATRSREDADRRYRSYLAQDLTPAFWAAPPNDAHWFAAAQGDPTALILRARAGRGAVKIAASVPNRGAVAGFKDRTVLEYSLLIDGDRIAPAGRYEVPDVLHGLIGDLATHQTLLGDAVAAADPRLLAEALFSYPVQQNTRASRALYRDLLAIHRDRIPAFCQGAAQYL